MAGERIIRKAGMNDLEKVLKVYASARQFMKEHGNATQWGSSNPTREVVENDIMLGQLFVIELWNQICGVFVYFNGEDPTYRIINNGNWHSDHPYGTIHRIAGNGQVSGIFQSCFAYARSKSAYIRIDTHANNYIMQRIVEKNGFQRCGIIYLPDGSSRIAYDYRA